MIPFSTAGFNLPKNLRRTFLAGTFRRRLMYVIRRTAWPAFPIVAYTFRTSFVPGQMSFMFLFAKSFSGTGLEQWSVGNTVTLFGTFHGASNFAADISTWDVSKVTDFTSMLQSAPAFSSSLCAWGAKITKPGVSVTAAFDGSGCPEQGDPDLSANPKGPFCFVCL